MKASRKPRREKMSNLRKTVAKRLVSAKNDTAMLTTFNEVNMKPIMDLVTRTVTKYDKCDSFSFSFVGNPSSSILPGNSVIPYFPISFV